MNWKEDQDKNSPQRPESIFSEPEPVSDEPHFWRNRLRERVSRLNGRDWLILSVVAVLVVLAVIWLWSSKSADEAAEEEANIVVSVRVAKAERDSIAEEVSAIGTIFPREEATVSAKMNAQIKQMALLKNKPVRAGQVIAVLESRDIQAQRDEAAAALQEARHNARLLSGGTIPENNAQDEKALRDAQAKVNNARALYERRLTLYEKGGISKKDLEDSQLALTTAENELRLAESAANLHKVTTNPANRDAAIARVSQAEERLASLNSQLSYGTIRAPFSGIITEQFQFEGEYASSGGKLFNIADMSEVIVKAPFADTVTAQLKDGTPARVLPQDQPGEEIVGQISLVSRSSDPQNRTVEIWIRLKNEGGRLRDDGAAKVIVTTNTETDALVVPASAVTLDATNADEGTVMVVDDESVAHETKVTVGIRTPDRFEITSGLKEGETVVIEGNYALPDGSKVEISEEGEDEKENEGTTGEAPAGGTPSTGTPATDGARPGQNQETQPQETQSGAQSKPGSSVKDGAMKNPGTKPEPKTGAGAKSNPGAKGGGAKP